PKQGVAKPRKVHLFYQLVPQFSAAAVGEDNLLVIGDRQRTGSAEKRGVVHHSNDIFGAERDVDQIPKHVHQGGMHFLNPVDAVRRHDETVIRDLGETATVFSAPRDGEHLFFARFFERVDQIWRFAAGTNRKRHVPLLTEQTQLIDEDPGKIDVVAYCSHCGCIIHQRNHRKCHALFYYGMCELDRKMHCIAQTTAVAHGQKFLPIDETFGHVAAESFDVVGIFLKKLLLHFHALAAFAQNLVAEAFVKLVDLIFDSRRHGAATAASVFSKCRP